MGNFFTGFCKGDTECDKYTTTKLKESEKTFENLTTFAALNESLASAYAEIQDAKNARKTLEDSFEEEKKKCHAEKQDQPQKCCQAPSKECLQKCSEHDQKLIDINTKIIDATIKFEGAHKQLNTIITKKTTSIAELQKPKLDVKPPIPSGIPTEEDKKKAQDLVESQKREAESKQALLQSQIKEKDELTQLKGEFASKYTEVKKDQSEAFAKKTVRCKEKEGHEKALKELEAKEKVEKK